MPLSLPDPYHIIRQLWAYAHNKSRKNSEKNQKFFVLRDFEEIKGVAKSKKCVQSAEFQPKSIRQRLREISGVVGGIDKESLVLGKI